MRLDDALEQYVRWLLATRDLSPHTVRAYTADLACLERHLGPGREVDRIDHDGLISFIEDQKARGLSPASIKRRAASLRGFCRWLRSRGLIDADPWDGMTLSLGHSRRLPRTVSAHELDRLIAFLKQVARIEPAGAFDSASVAKRPHASTTLLAVALMVATGVRVHEAVGIRRQDVDLPSRSIRLLGKGRRERHVYLTNPWITGLTGTYMDARSTIGGTHPYLLFSLRDEPLSPAAMRSRLAKAASAAGLSRRITPHMLRHTAATQLIEAGVDIRYIQRLLGHASLSTTEIYTHVSDEALRRTVTDADVLGKLGQVR